MLENVFDPHNISAVMRTCDAGVQDIYVLNTKIPSIKNGGLKAHPALPSGLLYINSTMLKNAFRHCGNAIQQF